MRRLLLTLCLLLLGVTAGAQDFTRWFPPGGGGAGGGAFTAPLLAPAANNCAAVPYSFTGDTTLGTCSSAAGTLNLYTAGSSRLAINSTAVTSTVPMSITATEGAELVTINAACDGWTFTGTGYACGGDGTVTKVIDGIGTAYYSQAMEVGAIYKVTVVTSNGTWAATPSTRPFLVYLGDAGAEFISSDTTTTFYRQAQTTGKLTITTEANGGTSVPRAKFTVSVKKLTGGGFTAKGTTVFNGPVQIDGILTLPGNMQFRSDPFTVSFYLGRGIAPNLSAGVFGNTVIGTYAGLSLTSGGDNTLMGANTGASITTGQYNTAIGVDSMMRVAGNNSNTALGKTAMWGLTGANNTAVGLSSLYSPAGTGSGAENVAAGAEAGYSITTGTENVFVGYRAGYSVAGSNENVIIGKEAGYITGATAASANALTGQGDNVFIGYRAGQDSATQRFNLTVIGANAYADQSNAVVLGDELVTDVLASSDGGATIAAGGLSMAGDVFLYRDAAANFQLGADAATATAQTISAADSTGAGIAGGNLTLQGGDPGAGGTAGSVILDSSASELTVTPTSVTSTVNFYVGTAGASGDDQLVLDPGPDTADAEFAGTITSVDLTAARTYTLPDASGTFITSGNSSALVSGETNNELVTSAGADAGLVSEAALTFDGVALVTTGAGGIQGSNSKALTDATATAFARISIPQTIATNYKGGQVIYEIYCDDDTNQASQAGTVKFTCHNIAGTEACGFGTPDGVTLGDGTASLAAPTFDANSGAADTIDLRVNSDCTGVVPNTHTIQWRLDLPTVATITPQ